MTIDTTPIPVLLLVRELHIGGTERQVAIVAKHLDPKQFSVRVCCFRQGGIRQIELEAAGVPVWELPVRAFWSPASFAHALSLRKYLIRENIAIVHSFSPATTVFAVPIARSAKVPVVLSSCRAERSLMRPRDAWLVRKTDRWVDGIIANCHYLRQALVSESVPAELVTVCSNGVNLNEFFPGFEERPPTIGTTCVLRPEKGLPILIDAFARISPRFPAARLRIVGSGPLRESLAQQAIQCGIGDTFELVAGAPQIGVDLRKLRIFVSPSLSEGLSNSLLEAMACGCTVVASRAGGAAEVIRHNENGLLFDISNTEQLASILEMLLADRDWCLRLGQAASRTIREHFSAGNAAQQMQDAYFASLARVQDSRPAVRSN